MSFVAAASEQVRCGWPAALETMKLLPREEASPAPSGMSQGLWPV